MKNDGVEVTDIQKLHLASQRDKSHARIKSASGGMLNELLKDTPRHTKVQKETLSCDKLHYLVWEVAVECDIAEGGTAIVHQDRIKWSEKFQD